MNTTNKESTAELNNTESNNNHNNFAENGNIINLKQLKRKLPEELQAQAEELKIENINSLLKQELVFAILKNP